MCETGTSQQVAQLLDSYMMMMMMMMKQIRGNEKDHERLKISPTLLLY
jgi:hypothetical protein